MKKLFTIALIATTYMGLLSVSVFAADGIAADKNARSNRDVNASSLDGKTEGANIRVSKLIGRSIENSDGKNVGTINDIVVNANTGKVQYAAVTYGGFLGMGNKMFAVPFEAFKCKTDPNGGDSHVLILDVNQKQLEGSTGFDEKSWPNFGDQNFVTETYRRYGIERRFNGDRPNVDVNINRNGVDVNLDRDRR